MALKDMTKAQLVNIILRKDDVEIRLKKEIVSLIQENEQLDKEYKKMKRLRILTICLILAITCVVSVVSSASTTQKKIAGGTGDVRWPDFLRGWAAEYEINDSQRLSLINLIDSVYYFFEDSTQAVEAHSNQVCRMVDQIADVIANDSVFEFTLMMRATASNFWSQASKDDRIYQCNCSGESISRFAEWQTVSFTDVELLCFTVIPRSWEAPWHFANIILTIGKDDEEPLSSFVITNYEDFQMDSIQISFYDSVHTVLDVVYENEVYVDSTNAARGVKTALMPYKYLMQMLSQSLFVDVSYKTKEGWYSMKGAPGASFKEQIKDCTRLKMVLDEFPH